MTYEVLDTILGIYLGALAQGTAALQTYSLRILAVFALATYCTNLWSATLNNSNGQATALMTCLSIGLWYWISVSLGAMAIAAFDSFTMLGARTGGGWNAAAMLMPSRIWGRGWEIAKPLLQVAQQSIGWPLLFNWFNVAVIWASLLVILLAFFAMSLFIMLVQIQFRVYLMLGTILLPLGVYQATAFMAEFGLGMLAGGLIHTFIVAALLALSAPLMGLIVPQLGPAGEPTFETALVMAVVSGGYVALLIILARKGSMIAVRGLGLGLGSEAFSIRNMARAASMVMGPAVRGAVQGASRLLQARRGTS